jgi:hypothetical protein
MPKFSFSKQDMEGKPPLPAGIYEVRLDGFRPKKAKKGDSINLNPQMKVINHPTLNDSNAFYNLSTAFGPGIIDFCHCFGQKMENEGSDSPDFPGEFPGDPDDPTKWSYIGPLVGQVGRVEIAETDDGKGGHTTKHRESLL